LVLIDQNLENENVKRSWNFQKSKHVSIPSSMRSLLGFKVQITQDFWLKAGFAILAGLANVVLQFEMRDQIVLESRLVAANFALFSWSQNLVHRHCASRSPRTSGEEIASCAAQGVDSTDMRFIPAVTPRPKPSAHALAKGASIDGHQTEHGFMTNCKN